MKLKKSMPMRRPDANKAINNARWYDSSQTIPKSSVIDDFTTLWSKTSSDLSHVTNLTSDKSPLILKKVKSIQIILDDR